jgi:hypothetical protein
VSVRWGKPAILAGAMTAVIGLAACSSASDPGHSGSATTGQVSPPSQVTAKPAGGTPGKGPLIVSSPAAHRGRKIGSQRVALSDRILVIKSVTARPASNHGSILIVLDLVVRNTSEKPVQNEATFFELLGPEADAFSPKSGTSADFYRPIAAHASRRGTIKFEIPAAAASDLHLLYRPEIATETVLIRVKAG